jgi:hypothetical protein
MDQCITAVAVRTKQWRGWLLELTWQVLIQPRVCSVSVESKRIFNCLRRFIFNVETIDVVNT